MIRSVTDFTPFFFKTKTTSSVSVEHNRDRKIDIPETYILTFKSETVA